MTRKCVASDGYSSRFNRGINRMESQQMAATFDLHYLT